MNRGSFLVSAVLLAALSARAAEPAEPVDPVWNLRVHLLSDDERVELRHSLPQKDYTVVCKTPCDRVVQFRQADEFRLAGDGLLSSEPFEFRPRNGDVTLKVSTGKRVPIYVGTAIAFAGGLAANIGLYSVMWARQEDVSCAISETCGPHDTLRKTGYILMASGLAVFATGVAILLFSPRTGFTVEQ